MTSQHSVPLARKKGLLIQELTDETLIYDQVHQKAYCLNDTAARIWCRCDGKASVSRLAEDLEKELSTPVDEAVIWIAIEQFSKARLLEAPIANSGTSRVSRRDLLRRAGVVAAVALPLV